MSQASPSVVEHTPRRARWGERSGGAGVQSLDEVLPEVLDVLDADREPDQSVGDGGGLALPPPATFEGGLDAAERGGVDPEAGGVLDEVGDVVAAALAAASVSQGITNTSGDTDEALELADERMRAIEGVDGAELALKRLWEATGAALQRRGDPAAGAASDASTSAVVVVSPIFGKIAPTLWW